MLWCSQSCCHRLPLATVQPFTRLVCVLVVCCLCARTPCGDRGRGHPCKHAAPDHASSGVSTASRGLWGHGHWPSVGDRGWRRGGGRYASVRHVNNVLHVAAPGVDSLPRAYVAFTLRAWSGVRWCVAVHSTGAVFGTGYGTGPLGAGLGVRPGTEGPQPLDATGRKLSSSGSGALGGQGMVSVCACVEREAVCVFV